MSQQNLYDKFVPENPDSNINEQMVFYWKIILDYWTGVISKHITWMESYSYDFAIIETKSDKYEPYFIEPNGFGAEYPAGSALFHWILDKDKLYRKTNQVYLRYTNFKILKKIFVNI